MAALPFAIEDIINRNKLRCIYSDFNQTNQIRCHLMTFWTHLMPFTVFLNYSTSFWKGYKKCWIEKPWLLCHINAARQVFKSSWEKVPSVCLIYKLHPVVEDPKSWPEEQRMSSERPRTGAISPAGDWVAEWRTWVKMSPKALSIIVWRKILSVRPTRGLRSMQLNARWPEGMQNWRLSGWWPCAHCKSEEKVVLRQLI